MTVVCFPLGSLRVAVGLGNGCDSTPWRTSIQGQKERDCQISIVTEPWVQRFVIVAEDGKILRLKVEDDAPNVTVTAAENVLTEA